MSRRGASSIAANPVLIGAATTLVIIVAVFLAYNANAGLPFVPTYQLNANVPSGANLVTGNEVRVGGTRVGTVTNITPRRGRDGRFYAELEMKLQTTVKPLPTDSTVLIRPRSALGLKYVEITKGEREGGFVDGATVPLRNAKPRQVEIDDVLNTFDEKTREASRVNLAEFGNALAGRGQDLNRAIEAFNPLLSNLVPVMRGLSSSDTKLERFFQSLGRAASEVAPVAETQGELFQNLDTTFTALADVAPEIQDTISSGPAALDAGIRGFPRQRPFLANTAGLFRELRPGARALRTAAPALADAFVTGTRTLRRSVAFNNRLIPTFRSLERFADDPLTRMGINDLRNTAGVLAPTLETLRPTQTVCNYLTLWFRNVSSLLSEGDTNGTWQRFIIVATPTGQNNEGGPSSRPANGTLTPPGARRAGSRQLVPTPAGGGDPRGNFLHSNPYPEISNNECEAANERYIIGKKTIGNVPGVDATKTEKTVRSLDD